MSTRKISDETARSYYEKRIEPLTKRLIDIAESLFGKESIAERREFEEHVEKRLQNGAKFIPRKRQSR
jgi:hypothetical protein